MPLSINRYEKEKPDTKKKKNAQSITVDSQSSYNLPSNQHHRAVTTDRSNSINTPRKKLKLNILILQLIQQEFMVILLILVLMEYRSA